MSVSVLKAEAAHEAGGLVAGVATATVSRNDDPDQLGRVKLRIPWREKDFETDWARIAVPMAGGDRGTFFLPEVGDEVLVAFDRDDIRYPYVLGALWSKEDKPPEKNADGKNDVRIIKTRDGHVIKTKDGSRGAILIELKGGEQIEVSEDGIVVDDTVNKVTLDKKGGSVTVQAAQSIKLTAPRITVEASASLDLNGGGSLIAKAGMVRIN